MCAAKLHEDSPIDSRQAVLRSLRRLIPDPLFTCIVVGVPLLGSVALVIGRAFVDLDLRLVVSSGWFLLALSIAFFTWLIATVLGRRQLGSFRFRILITLFFLGATVAGYGALVNFRYRYNDFGFYELRGWHRSGQQSQGKVVLWKWRLIAVKENVVTLSFHMPANPPCQFSNFSPKIPKPTAREAVTGVHACDISSEGTRSDTWIIEDFGRPGEVVFLLGVCRE